MVHNHRKILETTSCTNIQRFVLPTSHVVLNPGLILVSLYRYLGHLCHGCEIASPLCASIGGKVVETEQVLWFSEQVSMTEVRHWKPEFKKDAQKFEVLAQLALLMAASSRLLCDQMELCILSSSDNTSAESSINRQLSTKEPTATFLKWISQWAYQHHMSLSISHIAGHDNTWADDLSRDRCEQWSHYPRVRFDLQSFFSIGRKVKLFRRGRSPRMANLSYSLVRLKKSQQFFLEFVGVHF